MPTTFHSSKNKNLSLFSPLTLLVLLAFLFTYFLTASNQSRHPRNADAEVMYKTNGEAFVTTIQ